MATLVPKDLQDFMKRLRRRIHPETVRFFAVGEYGDDSWRPHYHVALFGFQSCRYGQSRYSRLISRCCDRCELVRTTWSKGNVFLGTLENDSAGYLAGYTTKKMTAYDDERLKGRHPEFARMSLRPGIGYDAMYEISDVLLRYDLHKKLDDVPATLRSSSVEKSIGRYLRKRLRVLVGKDEKAPKATLDKIQSEMLALRLAARASEDDPSFKSQVVKAGEAKYQQFVGRAKLRKKRRRI